jgi:hypothetical protein
VNWSFRVVTIHDLSLIRRVQRPPCSGRMVPRPGIEPRSARYQRAALPLCYQGVAGCRGFEPHAREGTIRLAGGDSDLAACAIHIGGR